MKKILYAILFMSLPASAQRNEILANNIASLQVIAGTNWQGLPVTTLGGEPITISFDELSHEYHRFTYTIQHCEADWTPSESLFTSDYINGIYDDNTIDTYEESIDTYQLYTHYTLQFPNDKCRITMGGNYKVTVIDDYAQKPVLVACFMVNESSAGIQLEATTNTDIDINGKHQQLNMQVTYGGLDIISPEEQLNIVVMQNRRWDNAVYNPPAQYKMREGMKWEHCADLIFLAGTEYHKFETLDPSHITMGLSSVGWDKDLSQWHAYVFPDTPIPNYSYDVDANGSFLIRNSDNIDNNITCDYIMTHFELQAPQQQGRVYLNGAWTNQRFLPEYEMDWNEDKEIYEKTVYLKQGYYSYRYLVMADDGTTQGLSSEGNFFETENTYQALLYYRGNTDRTDRLVGFASISTR
jgi:hypothetical protein